MTTSAENARLGLCAQCVHAGEIPHPRGGTPYSICRLADTNSAFEKYPRTPVRFCPGYRAQSEDDASTH